VAGLSKREVEARLSGRSGDLLRSIVAVGRDPQFQMLDGMIG